MLAYLCERAGIIAQTAWLSRYQFVESTVLFLSGNLNSISEIFMTGSPMAFNPEMKTRASTQPLVPATTERTAEKTE